MLYGKPTKHIRHVNETTITLEPQRFYVLPLWKYASNAAARTDGDDLQDVQACPLGSKITRHKLDILVTPETIEPQQLYIGRLKLSFQDVYNESHCGGFWTQASYGDEATESFTAKTNPIATHLYPKTETNNIRVGGDSATNQEFGGSGSGYGINEVLLDDNFKHVCNLKKVTVFDQRPLMGERWQRIPSKVKRINDGTFYGMLFFNDSTRGATPADTQLTIKVKSYFEEKAI